MTAEQIVRALAVADPVEHQPGWPAVCGLCTAEGKGNRFVEEHEPDCPWRLAVEWVAAQEDEP